MRTVVHGATGKMGREVLAALCREADLRPVGAVARSARQDQVLLPDGSGTVPCAESLDGLLSQVQADVVVDFTSRAGALEAARVCARHAVHLVTGTSGIAPPDVEEMDRLAREAGTGTVIAPNFALGAVLLLHLAKEMARFFDYAEVIELHHAAKADAPSGTALATARALLEGRDGVPFTHPDPQVENLPGTRGGQVGGVGIHAVRLPGLLAHQEVIFGAAGQTLTLRHDTITRECYMPGVLLAIRKVGGTRGVTFGLERLLGLV